MSNQGDVTSLIDQAVPPSNPLNQALRLLVDDLYRVYNAQYPSPTISRNLFASGTVTHQNDVTNFVATIQPTNLHLSWNTVVNAATYEIRYGASWDAATFVLQTASLQAEINPFTIPLVYGTYNFLIKAIDAAGVFSNNAASSIVVIPVITSPAVNTSVIGNNVLFTWSTPTSVLQIKEYIVTRNGSEVGRISGTFDIIFEPTGGTYTYTITPVDIVGNVGAASANIVLTLSNPTDFQFQASLTSTLNGTKLNTVIDTDGTLFAIIDPTISYEQHFITGG